MTKEAVEKIKAAEAEAEEIKSAATALSREAVMDARREAAERQGEVERSEHDKMEKKIAIAKERANTVIQEKSEIARHEAVRLKSEANSKMKDAVKTIIGGVVVKWQ